MFFAATTFFALAGLAAAAPTTQFQFTGCDVSASNPDFPAGQTALAVPSGASTKFIGLGVGVQNYTCSAATGTFASAGAVATLYDVSCLVKVLGANFSSLPADVTKFEANAPAAAALLQKQLGKPPVELGVHIFVPSPSGTGISPFFDFTVSQTTATDPTFLGAKTGDIASPAGKTVDVDWLALSHVQGDLATTVFRVDTSNGVPPTSCTAGQATSIPYAANYYFYA